MKKTLIVRGDIENPIILQNGDKYDSTIILSDSNSKTLFVSGKVNTDHTSSYRGGIIAEGSYFAICGIREKNKEKALWLYNKEFGIVKRKEDLPERAFILRSLVPNPNHGGKLIITYVLIHKGGLTWDWSHGCITILDKDFDKFISYFEVGEVTEVTLRRGAFWKFKEVA